MRILIVSAVFPPEPVVSSMTSSQLARFLAAQGHDVSVVTGFPNRPQGKLYPGYRRRLFRQERTPDGYRLVRCFGTLSPKSTMLSRLLENLSFGLTSGWFVLTSRRPDAVFANTWPVLAQGILSLVARARRLKLILTIQDIYPESLIAQRRISQNGFLARGFRAIDRLVASAGAAVVVPAPSFADVYSRSRRLPREKLRVVPNWLDRAQITANDGRAGEVRQKLGIPAQASMLLYGGNVGAAAGVETLIESFKHLRGESDIYLTVAGDGANMDACQELASGTANPRIRFYRPWPADETSRALSAADILILPTRGRQSLASIPSKLIAYMLAARPVLALALPESDLALVIRRSGCGWVIAPDQPSLLAATIKEALGESRKSLQARGLAGRDYALANFTGEACLPKLAALIIEPVPDRV